MPISLSIQSKRINLIVDWFMEKMNLSKDLNISINFVKFDENQILENSDGEKMMKLGNMTRDENGYVINIKRSLLACNDFLLIKYIYHELVHVYQYECEKFDVKDGYFYYDGEKYPINLEYEKRPWEINAFSWSNNLASEYISGLNPSRNGN